MKKPLLVLFILFSALLSAQSVGSLSGRVRDINTGETLTGVTVSVQGVAQLTTNFDGYFNLSSLKPGLYSVICHYLSYANKTIIVDIKAGESTFLPISMEEPAFDATEGISTTAIPASGTSSN